MNDQQKIELADFIIHETFSFNADKSKISLSDSVLNKIHELEQKPNSYDEQLRWHHNTLANCEENPVNNENSASDGKNTSSANTEIGQYQTNGDNLHICGVCYQSYSTDVLKTNFQICPDCQHAEKIKIGVNDKNGQVFFSGETLWNEKSLTTGVKILQISPTHIVFDGVEMGGHCIPTQDFIDAGWIVHERVTVYKKEGTNSAGCVTRCKFHEMGGLMIGSLFCQECKYNKGINKDQQWIICEQYNRENEDGK